ncbi:UDP-N-acetylglucosamine 2-epimerase [Paralcaligenes ureilyticus]|uniref:UDP-N-acetylglucosamine 2-epimerase n=2 Tax=Paralcaligenes ureilyticus TaxID=627131 RepID=A0A4R3M7L8_9BURK|nr:UDP-N-acetylglucosamine 2-epimerase [Paralcaligenes ureilyticus]
MNLSNEGIRGERVRLVGDVMFDAVKLFGKIAEQRSSILDRLELQKGGYILVTLHRQENVDDPKRLASIIQGLSRSQRPVVFPLHPRTRKRITEFGIELDSPIRVIDPIGYLDMMLLERNARVIATDSGGVQKEAYFHGVPCLTLRDETEWVELVDIGVNRVVGADSNAIGKALCEHEFDFAPTNIYGSGVSAEEIVGYMMRAMNND